MSVVSAVVYAVHMLFAGLWTGSVVFVTVGVLPTATSGDAEPGPMATVTGRLRTVSRASALVLLLTGGHMAVTQYGLDGLLSSVRGYLVVAMVVLWFLLAGLVEVGGSKLADGFAADKLREPAREARPFFLAASLVAALLLLDAGVIIGFW